PRGYRRSTMACQVCWAQLPTKYVEFYQNIGAIVLRFSKSIKGELCKGCIDKHFWEFTLITLALGWWGGISFFLTPRFRLQTIVRCLPTIGRRKEGLELVPRTAVARGNHPTLSLTEEASAKLDPFREEIAERLRSGEDAEAVASAVARKAGVSAAQA